ncbi:sorting nexin-5 isoform X2 [Rhincodon typus]|uniref:sorting nexin-5 isoform X2 n=1 Tax=Rhincodon typus TaxID=259920 RepID=UPI0020309ABF|nr:sorting nexin-5 isoform X2 [Rhincodon typus]
MSDNPVNLGEGNKLASVSMEAEPSILVDIPDALSEREKVKFTVHTKTTLPSFKKSEFSVIRQHEDFVWLHDTLVENDDYAGIIIPPAPAKPDFDVAREKMQKLGEGEGSMSKEEFNKMKQELEAEYLAVFKKTVSIHEVFLQRLAVHSVLGKDHNFHVFLEYDQDLSVRRKNTKEMFGGFLKSMMKSADEVLVSGARDADEFFEHEKTFLVEYGIKIKDSAVKAEKMTKVHKNVSDDYLNLSSSLNELAIDNKAPLNNYYINLSELFEKLRDLLYRRARALVDYENANKTLDKARMKGKDVKQAELQHQLCGQKFEKLSESAKQELTAFRARRVGAFRKNLIEMTELELKHARTNVQMIQSCLAALMSN